MLSTARSTRSHSSLMMRAVLDSLLGAPALGGFGIWSSSSFVSLCHRRALQMGMRYKWGWAGFVRRACQAGGPGPPGDAGRTVHEGWVGGRGVRGGGVVLPGVGLRLRPVVLVRRSVRSARLGWGTRVVGLVMGGAALAGLRVAVVGRLIRIRAYRSSSGVGGESGTRWARSDRVGVSGCVEPIRAARAGRMGRAVRGRFARVSRVGRTRPLGAWRGGSAVGECLVGGA